MKYLYIVKKNKRSFFFHAVLFMFSPHKQQVGKKKIISNKPPSPSTPCPNLFFGAKSTKRRWWGPARYHGGERPLVLDNLGCFPKDPGSPNVRWWLGFIITSLERYLGSITILRRWLDNLGVCVFFWRPKIPAWSGYVAWYLAEFWWVNSFREMFFSPAFLSGKWMVTNLLLMAARVHQLRERWLLPFFTMGFLNPRWLALGFLNHQQ